MPQSHPGSPFIDNEPNEEEIPNIPIEIVSEDEMALIETAFALAAKHSSVFSSSSSVASAISASSHFRRNVRSVQSISIFSKRGLGSSRSAGSAVVGDIEDSGGFRSTQKKAKMKESFLHRFRRKKGLSITDITATEWCEKQMEFILLHGKPKVNKAMKAGTARHVELEQEVVKKIQVNVTSVEDAWALKLVNFIVGVNQLLFEGLTRELPIIGFVQGVWLVGVIDEIRMPAPGTDGLPLLVDTKTRVSDTLPAEPQQRNGRLQLMCYKYLWDKLVADDFPPEQFYDFFALNPHNVLCEDIRERTANVGFPTKTLDDLVMYFKNTCSMLPLTSEQLLLRYEYQEDNSLLGENQFEFDFDWLERQFTSCLEFWQGERDASCTPEDERWKCRFCKFASVCPANTHQ